MDRLKDEYQIEETSQTFSFRPFYRQKKTLKWYLMCILILGGLLVCYFDRWGYTFLTISLAIILICTGLFLKIWLLYIPIRYTFDAVDNAVYQSNLLFRKRKILILSEIVIFRNSEMGSWHYAMGEKKKQFLKNYAISPDFSPNLDGGKEKEAYVLEILTPILKLMEK